MRSVNTSSLMAAARHIGRKDADLQSLNMWHNVVELETTLFKNNNSITAQ